MEINDCPSNCGIGIIGEFPAVNHGDNDGENSKNAEGIRGVIQALIYQNQNPETDEEGTLIGDMISPKKVYIATTSEHQPSTEEALENLHFRVLTSWKGDEGKIKLWFRKANIRT